MVNLAETVHAVTAGIMALTLVVSCALWHVSHGPASEPVLDALTSLATGYAFGRSTGALPGTAPR